MRKRNRNLLIALVVLIGIIAIVSSGKLPFAVTGTCYGGSTINSISSAEITSSSDLAGKKIVRAFISSLPSGDCLNVDISPSSLQSALNSAGVKDFIAQKNLKLNIDLIKQGKQYDLSQDTTKTFYKLNIQKTPEVGLCTHTDVTVLGVLVRSTCTKAGFTGVFASLVDSKRTASTSDDECLCFSDSSIGYSADFKTGSTLTWQTSVALEGYTPIILSNSVLSQKIGEVAFVKWGGNIGSNSAFSSIDKDAIFRLSDNKFSMIDSGKYDNLKQDYELVKSNLKKVDGPTTASSNTIDNTIVSARGYNSGFDASTRDQTTSWASGETIVSSASISGNKLNVEFSSPVVYPSFTIDILAEKVGIFVTEGIPKVTCPSTITLDSGSIISSTLKVSNIGDNGAFTYSVKCNKASATLSPMPPITINHDDSRDIRADIGFTTEQTSETDSCLFTASSSGSILSSQKSDSCSFSVISKKTTGCKVGTLSCEQGSTELWECNSDGSYKKAKCDYGCEAFENSYRCRLQAKEICDNKIDDDGDGKVDLEDIECTSSGQCKWYNPICWFKQLFSGVFGFLKIIKMIIVFLGGIVTIFASADILERFRSLNTKKGKVIRWIIAIILGILVATALVKFIGGIIFWIIAVAIGLYFFFAPRILGPLMILRGRR